MINKIETDWLILTFETNERKPVYIQATVYWKELAIKLYYVDVKNIKLCPIRCKDWRSNTILIYGERLR